ncbi:MAG: carbohydrate-binding family 9-like protein [Labilibaculum antarcticum]
MTEYIVKRIKANMLNLTGGQMHPVWEMANINTDFSYPWEEEKAPKTTFRALHDDNNLFFRFDAEDENVRTFVDEDHKMEVVNSDRVEIFFRQDDKLKPYYCLEMDSHSRVLDYVTRYYRDFDYQWEWPEGNLEVKASENSKGYVVEGSIKLSSLKEFGLLKKNRIEAGLYRGYCMGLPEGNKEADLRWISWVKPDSEEPDFHIPSSFGRLKLEA